ncbi:MAG TPA: V-type ATP synthase subunit E [Spirochaetales bacterium]|nr:V-type ATP synthase subunit E [Spirochaetales bacterium]
MDIRLQELLEKIKRDGVEAAGKEAARIAAEAEAGRKAIIEAAEREAKALREKAAADAARAEEAGKAAIAQAARDAALAFRKEIDRMLAALTRDEVARAYDADAVAKAIPAVLAGWKGEDAKDLTLLVPAADLARVEAALKAKLADSFKAGLELKSHPTLKAGFRIARKDGAAYYDYSAESVAEILGQHLNASVAAIVEKALAAD